ncbi:MAG TPA: oxalate/formate MFS antiporter [Vicinamibacterales bacterium]|nr:oxalate/formate MFS antiporter [Vicinamibacterales bacterium]
MRIHNRWFQLCASLVAMIMIANLQYAWTLFVQPLQQGTGWKLSDIQYAFALFILFQTWVQPLDGWLIDRIGPRWFISVAGLLCGLGWAGMGYAKTLPMLYALYCLAGVGAAFVYSGSIGSALKWFKERRGLASGIMAAGFGGGTALFIPFISYMIANRGYQAAFLSTGVFQGIVIVVVAQVLRHPAPTAAAAPATAAARRAQDGPQLTTFEMLRTPQFYMMYASFVMMATGFLLATANLAPIARSWGLTAAAVTLAATFSPIANGASRVFWGWASDRTGRENAMVLAFTLNAACLLGVLKLGQLSGGWFAFSLVLVYFTGGQIYSLFPSTTADYFGTRHATSNYAVLYTAKGVAAFIGAWGGPLLFERFGNWDACFYGSAALALIAAVMAWGLRASVAAPRAAGVGVPA